MIVSFRGKFAAAIANGERLKGFPNDLVDRANRRLQALHNAILLEDLRSPPGNRLEVLKGDRAGQHAIRINDQWRICFRWTDAGAEDVEIVDYH